jgi:hypothetical protein
MRRGRRPRGDFLLRRGSVQHLDAHPAGSLIDHAQAARCAVGEVQGSPAHERPAIRDAKSDGAAIREIGDADDRAERERWMRGRERVLVEDFPTGGAMTVEPRAVPGRIGDLVGRDDLVRGDRGGRPTMEERAAARHCRDGDRQQAAPCPGRPHLCRFYGRPSRSGHPANPAGASTREHQTFGGLRVVRDDERVNDGV